MASSITPKQLPHPWTPSDQGNQPWYVPVEAVGYYLHTDGEVRQGILNEGRATGYFDTKEQANEAISKMIAYREALG